MKDQLLKIYNTTEIKDNQNHVSPYKIKLNFDGGAKVDVVSKFDKNEKFKISFFDNFRKELIYSDTIGSNMWCGASKKYYCDWEVQVETLNSNKTKKINFDLKGKKVKISNESPSLGDCIAWTAVIEDFQKKHNCKVDYFTPFSDIFKNQYKSINIKPYKQKYNNEDYYVSYQIGYFFDDKSMTPFDPRERGLQELACDILGLDFVEKPPKIFIENPERPIKEKYVCISTSSTAGCKHWQNKGGWQKVVDYLNNLGYKVVVIQKESLTFMDLEGLDNVLHPETKNIQEAITWLANCEFYIGLGSGISWLSWALRKKVVMISGFSKPFAEFSNPYRVINANVCNGCWNNLNHKFNAKDWNWCPEGKNFECSKEISFEMVQEKIDNCIQFLN